ncbi:mechanosensitive ion channel family protein [Pedobacter antarcticus]|uniref:mechanosensitive ion channel family protein n=1 Tax=Pedobacter antarcticus TaxID=34086 RepID=UPI00088DC040|nr:mechanosensitive ion channel domain-containing protein [Pedobacter antarcticus]SDL74170.1 Small-conductance mechanosensitive channel [Pedobacter antarcticus]
MIVEDKSRKRTNELVMIALKTLILCVLIYLLNEYTEFADKYPKLTVSAKALVIFLGPSLAVSFIRQVIIYWYIKKHGLPPNIKDNFILGINRIVSILNTVFGIVAMMIFLGTDPLKFLTSITIVAAAIAVTFKDYINNMINGLIIMFSDRLSLGDHIRVNDTEGKILDITLINVILQNEDNDMVMVPNSVVFSSVIVNQSKQNIKKLSIEFEMALSYGYLPAHLEEILSASVKSYDDYIVRDGLTIKTLAVGKDTVRFKVQVLLNRYDKIKEREIRRALNTAIIRLSLPAQ